MKRIVSIILLCAACFSAQALSFQARNDYNYYRNYYNPATRFQNEGIFIQAYANYTHDMPVLAGKEPLDLQFDLMVARKNWSAFASVSHDEYSYFCGVCLTAGYNHIFNFGEDHSLRIGGRALLGLNSVDFSHLPYEFPVSDNRSRIVPTPDIDLGIEYRYKFFHLGASVKNVIGTKGKFKGVTYVSFPRAYLLHMRFDANIVRDKLMLNPFAVLGHNQNIMAIFGNDIVLWKNYRVGYSFRVPDLHHNVYASVDIKNRVSVNVGYSTTPAHKYSSVHIGVSVRL